jgi:hypothetical protein
VAFGKRKVPIGQPAVEQEPANQTQAGQAPPDAPQPEHQQGKVLPDEVWQGKTGDMLRMLGMSPNDPSNLVPDANSVNARLDRDRAKFEARLAEMNRTVAERVPGGQMRGFSLLPDPCWNGEMGQLLMMRLELFPYDDWNMIFLPATSPPSFQTPNDSCARPTHASAPPTTKRPAPRILASSATTWKKSATR